MSISQTFIGYADAAEVDMDKIPWDLVSQVCSYPFPDVPLTANPLSDDYTGNWVRKQ